MNIEIIKQSKIPFFQIVMECLVSRLSHVMVEIFLNLGPMDLHTCRQVVCRLRIFTYLHAGSVQGVGIRGEIIVPARRLELKHDATEVELTSTVRFL